MNGIGYYEIACCSRCSRYRIKRNFGWLKKQKAVKISDTIYCAIDIVDCIIAGIIRYCFNGDIKNIFITRNVIYRIR